MVDYTCSFKVGDRVRTTAAASPNSLDRFGTISNVIPVFEELEDDEGNINEGEVEYYDIRVLWDNESNFGYYDESELEHIDEAASFIPEDWS